MSFDALQKLTNKKTSKLLTYMTTFLMMKQILL